MTLLYWKVCRKPKSSCNLEYLQWISSNFLTILTRSAPYLLHNTSTINKLDGNLSLALNIKTSGTIRILIVPNYISSQQCVSWKRLTFLDENSKMTFNLQYGKILSVKFYRRSLISNEFLLRNGKTKFSSFFWRNINIQVLNSNCT